MCCIGAGLAGERVRWESSISGYESFLAALPGDALLAAAFLSYAGPFPSEFRDELAKGTWIPQVRDARSRVLGGNNACSHGRVLGLQSALLSHQVVILV